MGIILGGFWMLQEYNSDRIKNVAIIGHLSTGKSTLLDSMLFAGGKINKIGTPETGLTSDYDEEEKERKMSIRSAMGFVEMDGFKINIIDTPGTADFVGETRAAIQACECAILIVDAVDGVQIETEKAWRYLSENNVPRMIFVNKMDKERANFDKVIDDIKKRYNASLAALTLPVGEGPEFKGVIDIIEMKMMTPKGDGKTVTVADIPAEYMDMVKDARNTLMEFASEGEDELIEKFLEGEELTDDEMKRGLGTQLSRAKLYPVMCGSSLKTTGVHNLLSVIKNYAPSPVVERIYQAHDVSDKTKKTEFKGSANGPVACIVWKTYIDQYAGRFSFVKVLAGELLPDVELFNPTRKDKERSTKLYAMIGHDGIEMPRLKCGDIGVLAKLDRAATCDTLCDPKNQVAVDFLNLPHPVYSFAIDPVNKSDVDKIGQYFQKVMDENPTITSIYNAETHETVLSGMGEQQLSIILQNLKNKNKIEVITREPRVAYRETITKKAESQYRHKKQSGGHGQFGEVFIRMEPLSRGEGFRFTESIFGGSIPKQYIPGVEKGLIEALTEGVLGRFPVVDVAVDLFDGKYHDVDSSEMAFKIAARSAFKQGMENAGPQLLEPVMKVSIYVDKEAMGDILSDITSRRGRVLGMDSSETGGGIAVVKAQVPLAEMLRYSIDLKGMTSGKGSFEMEFSHYDPISGRDAEKILEARRKQLEDEANK